MEDDKREMSLWSECTHCGKWIPDPAGDSYYDSEGNKVKTTIYCDDCNTDDRSFLMISQFTREGIEYKQPYGEQHIQFLVKDLIKKHGPKSDYRYTCLNIDLRSVWEAEEVFSISDNMPKWHARDGNERR